MIIFYEIQFRPTRASSTVELASRSQGLRFLTGVRLAADELGGVTFELVGPVAVGVLTGNANVGDGEADGVTDALGEGDAVIVGDGRALGVGLGLGDGGMMFSQ